VVGIGAQPWDRIYGRARPAGLHPFRQLVGAVHTAVSTPGDLLVHLQARRLDPCFEPADQLMRRPADLVEEVHGFRYFDERDLLGFVDRTESPKGSAATAAVFIGDPSAALAIACADTTTPAETSVRADGSLAIGSLRRSGTP
jgi:porphyrinogen peroxidase